MSRLPTVSRLPANDRSIAWFTILGHGLFHWFEMAIPIVLVAWIRDFPASVEVMGLAVAVGFAPIGLAALPGGVLADRFGSPRMVLLSLAGMTAGFGGLALAGSVPMIALGLGIWGTFAGLYHPGGMSLISTGAERQGTVFAYHGMAGNVGTALGPFVTATLLLFWGWRPVVAVLALPGLLAVILAVTLEFDPTAATDETIGARSQPRSLPELVVASRTLLKSAFVFVLAIVALDGLFYRGLLTYLPQVLREVPAVAALAVGPDLVGIEVGDYVFVGLLVVGIAGQYAGGHLSERIPVERGLALGFGALAVLAILFVPVSGAGFSVIATITALLGFFLFLVQPLYQVAVARYTPVASRGLAYGLTYLGEFGIGAGSIAVGGYLLGAYGVGALFGALAFVAGITALLAIVLGSGLASRWLGRAE